MRDRGEGTWKDANDICLAFWNYRPLLTEFHAEELRSNDEGREGRGMGDICCGKTDVHNQLIPLAKGVLQPTTVNAMLYQFCL